MSLSKIFKNKRELTFFATGILMFLIVLGVLFYSFRFLIKKLNQSLGAVSPSLEESLQFNVESIKNLQKQ